MDILQGLMPAVITATVMAVGAVGLIAVVKWTLEVGLIAVVKWTLKE